MKLASILQILYELAIDMKERERERTQVETILCILPKGLAALITFQAGQMQTQAQRDLQEKSGTHYKHVETQRKEERLYIMYSNVTFHSLWTFIFHIPLSNIIFFSCTKIKHEDK